MSDMTATTMDLHVDLKPLWAHQLVAVDQIMEHLEAGRNVIVDAPTGSGKSVIAAHVAARFGGRSIYMADEVQLVKQMAESHPRMFRTLVGHQQYCLEPWRCGEESIECSVCDRMTSWLGLHLVREHGYSWEIAARASEEIDCDYRVAKMYAAAHPYVTLSSQYFLTDKLYVKTFASRDLILLDECDAIQSTADRTFGADLTYASMERVGFRRRLTDTSNQERLLAEAEELLADLAEQVRAAIANTKSEEQKYRHGKLLEAVEQAEQLSTTADVIITQSEDGFALRLVDPAFLLTRHAWDGGQVPVVALSATPGRLDVFCRIAGLDPDNTVTVEMAHTFPRANRVVRTVDGPVMSKGGSNDPAKLDAMAAEILALAEGRTLVLVNSRAQAQALGTRLRGRAILHGSSQATKRAALEQLAVRPNGIVVSQSMWRGVDLVGDLCRTIIVAKLPFADWGDPLVKARAKRVGGWYDSETATKMVQGLGRGVRGPDDWCKLFILDGAYRTAHARFRTHLPPWFREALVLS